MGWVGAAFVVAALACQLVAGIFLMLLLLHRDGRFVLPIAVSFLLGLPPFGDRVADLADGIAARRNAATVDHTQGAAEGIV